MFIVHAQLSGCGKIDVGNPTANQQVPAQCNANTTNNGGKWPFKTKDPSTFRRADQGWDLQGNSPQIIYAIASGNIYKANNDPQGFGNFYPYEKLDQPITVNGHTYPTVYYGHIHYADGSTQNGIKLANVIGTHINEGDAIGYTYPGNWPANWLEIGFGDSVPAGSGAFPTGPGLDMEQYLYGKRLDYDGTGKVIGHY